MVKKLGIASIFVGVYCTLTSVLNFRDYATKEAGLEVDLLGGTSAYVQQYQGETPKEALDYTQRTLAIVGRNDAFKKHVNKLEKELQEISTQIGESKTPSVYQPCLNNIGEKINRILDDVKARRARNLLAGIGTGILALFSFGFGATEFIRKED